MNIIDSAISLFNPIAGLKRQQARNALSFAKERKYDAVSKSERNTFNFLADTSTKTEVSLASKGLAVIGNDLANNNPLAKRIGNVWANNATGTGVKCEVVPIRDNKLAKKKAKEIELAFDQWCKSKDSDFNGIVNFYKMQNLSTKSMVLKGGLFLRKHITAKGDLQIQMLDQSRLDTNKVDVGGDRVIDGIQYNKDYQVVGYWFRGEGNDSYKSTFVKAENIAHLFNVDKAEQHIGISWLAPVALLLEKYATLIDAKLMQQQISACFALVVEEPNQELGLTGSDDRVDELEPALITYVKAGSVPHTISPPKADNASQFESALKNDIAVGVDLTYEMLTGDYTKTNFASGRMSKSEFNGCLTHVQECVISPVLDKVFSWFVQVYSVKNNLSRNEFMPEWIFPLISSANPVEEFDVRMAKVRHGMLSPSKACKQGGEKLENVVEQWKKDKELFGDLPFDIDPSMFASTGNQLNVDDASSANSSSKADEPTSTKGKDNGSKEKA